MVPYEALLDAAARHFNRVAASHSYTGAARNLARSLEREARAELDAFNAGSPQRFLSLRERPHIHRAAAPAWREEDGAIAA